MWPQQPGLRFTGQQPSQFKLPQHTGVNALYCLIEIVVQHLLFLQQHKGKQGHQANADWALNAATVSVIKPRAKSLFMAGVFSVGERTRRAPS
jgi:hypothetical protein